VFSGHNALVAFLSQGKSLVAQEYRHDNVSSSKQKALACGQLISKFGKSLKVWVVWPMLVQ
jgi:hypothetical protein